MRTWTVRSVGARPLTVNAVVNLHRMSWAKHTADVRAEWCWLGRANGVKPCEAVSLVVTPLHKNARSPQDVAACAPEAKAAIDGLVDAGLIPDDSPKHLRSVTFLPPLIYGSDGLSIEIREEN